MTRTATLRPEAVATRFADARRVADVMLFEGYVLYPYRASARKNQLRWQFGVLTPAAYGAGSGEHSQSRTECLVEPRGEASVHVQIRLLQVQQRLVEGRRDGGFVAVASLSLPDREIVPWDEAVVREVDLDVPLDEIITARAEHPFTIPGGIDTEEVRDGRAVVGRLVRRRQELTGTLTLSADRIEGPYGAVRLHAVLQNSCAWTPVDDADRTAAVRHSLVAAHLLIAVSEASFLSMLDPPEWARPAVDGCVNEHTWPVLVGTGNRDDVVLSSPIIVYDHPQIAPESPGELYDSTEIDEILTLRTLALTDEEKREARGTDDRAAAVIDRVDDMPAEVLDRLHGTIRYLRDVTGAAPGAREDVPWWDPGADESVSPETDSVVIGGRHVAKGSHILLRPRLHGADAQDLFLQGRTATVEAVLQNVDDETHLAVTLDDDPGADLQRAEGRFLYFRPEEVEALP